MAEFWKSFWLCFFPLFVAVDALGTLPLFVGLTAGMGRQTVRRIIVQSVLTATIVALAFLVVGKLVFNLLGITIADFMIAGGTVLFAISLNDLILEDKVRRIVDPESLGAVPLGVPLIVGPAVLTTIILLLDAHGRAATVCAAIVNIAIAGIVFAAAEPINRLLGKAGAKTVSKVASLILAAIAVMLVRKGIVELLSK